MAINDMEFNNILLDNIETPINITFSPDNKDHKNHILNSNLKNCFNKCHL